MSELDFIAYITRIFEENNAKACDSIARLSLDDAIKAIDVLIISRQKEKLPGLEPYQKEAFKVIQNIQLKILEGYKHQLQIFKKQGIDGLLPFFSGQEIRTLFDAAKNYSLHISSVEENALKRYMNGILTIYKQSDMLSQEKTIRANIFTSHFFGVSLSTIAKLHHAAYPQSTKPIMTWSSKIDLQIANPTPITYLGDGKIVINGLYYTGPRADSIPTSGYRLIDNHFYAIRHYSQTAEKYDQTLSQVIKEHKAGRIFVQDYGFSQFSRLGPGSFLLDSQRERSHQRLILDKNHYGSQVKKTFDALPPECVLICQQASEIGFGYVNLLTEGQELIQYLSAEKDVETVLGKAGIFFVLTKNYSPTKTEENNTAIVRLAKLAKPRADINSNIFFFMDKQQYTFGCLSETGQSAVVRTRSLHPDYAQAANLYHQALTAAREK